MKHWSCVVRVTVLLLAALTLLPRVAVAQEPGSWVEYSGNPIFGQHVAGPKAYYPSVLYDAEEFSGHGAAARLKMWYGTSGGQTGLATSDDGINWVDQGVLMGNGYHATVEYYSEGFTGANTGDNPGGGTMYYRMWYWDPAVLYSVAAMRYAESPDGAVWSNDQSLQNGAVPIVSGGDPWWNRGSYGPCDILYNPGASNTGTDWTFWMYYDGTTGGDEAIGLGFSADGVTWTGYDRDGDGRADPVMTGTHIVGEWDRNYVSRAAILRENSTDYKMWYSGGVDNMNHGIGYAVSADGLSWTRAALNPIIYKDDGGYPGFPWRRERTYTPAVVRVGDLYQMWYSGKGDEDYSIGLAFARVAASEPVPEAGSLLMLVGGLACLAGYASLRWRRA